MHVGLISVRELKDSNSFVVVLADRSEAPTEWLEIQKSLVFDTRDKDLGMDTYCLVTSAGASRYGGVEACKLEDNRLEIVLSATAAADLGLDEQLEFELFAEASEIAALAMALRRIFDHDRAAPARLVL